MTYTSKSSILPCHGNNIECDKHLIIHYEISRDDAEKILQAIIRGPDMKGIGLDVPEWFANLFFGMRNFTETVIRLNPVLLNLTKKSKTRKG